MSDDKTHGGTVPAEVLVSIVEEAVRCERARIGQMLTRFAMTIVADESDLAKKNGVDRETKEAVQLAVGTFVSIFVTKLAEEPPPVVRLHMFPGATDESKPVVH